MKKVYWAPFIDNKDVNRNIIYNDPKSLYEILNKNKDKDIDPNGSMFSCPVINHSYRNIFCFTNPLKSEYKFKVTNTKQVISMPTYDKSMSVSTNVLSSLKDNIMFEYEPRWIFFSEESLDMVTSGPYFHKPEYTNYGAMTPGKLDISNWFRVINIQFNMWPGVDEFKIKKDEPLLYVNFITNDQIELVRFEMNDYLIKHARAIASAGEWEPRIPLIDRFERFKTSRTKDIVLKEIKKQVI
jgi:hypothetical protein